MIIDIYRSTKHRGKHISVPTGANISKIQFPENLDPDYLEVGAFQKALEIDAADKRIAMDAADVIAQIEDKGYALHGVKITFTEG